MIETSQPTLREQIDECIESGQSELAVAALHRYWRENSGAHGRPSTAAAWIVSRFERLLEKIPLTPYRLAILRSYTVEPLIPILRALGFLAGLDLSIHLGDFGTYVQEMVDPASASHGFRPQAVIL